MVVYSQNSNITVQGTPQHLAGIKNNTRAAIVEQRESSITVKGALQYLAGIKINTRTVVVVWRSRRDHFVEHSNTPRVLKIIPALKL